MQQRQVVIARTRGGGERERRKCGVGRPLASSSNPLQKSTNQLGGAKQCYICGEANVFDSIVARTLIV